MLKEILQGRWLKHPLHPALVHIPVALWPAALVCDLLTQRGPGSNALVQLSFFCIAFGLLASLVAIPTGIVDWLEIKKDKPAWKYGLYHMGLNVVVVVLFALNAGLRISTFQSAARVEAGPVILSAIAVLFLAGSAYLGGLMVFDQGIGVARFSKHKWRRVAEAGGANVPTVKGGQG